MDSIRNSKETIMHCASVIQQEVLGIDSIKKDVIPGLNTALSETQYHKDELSSLLVPLKKRKQRLAEEVVSLVVESNSLYVRTERNIKYRKPLMMHERDLIEGKQQQQ